MFDVAQWNSPGFQERYVKALDRFKTSPETLTDEDIAAIDTADGQEHGDIARRQRAKARSQTTAPDDDIQKLFARYPKQPITLKFLGTMFTSFTEGLVGFLKGKFDAMQIDVREQRRDIEEMKAVVAGLQTKMARGSTAGLRWGGDHETGKSYGAGEMVRKNGLWLCVVPQTSTAPGSDPTQWLLLVHRKISDR